MVSTITRAELKAKLDRKEKLILVEALPETYYRDKHLPGAINIPHDQVDALAPVRLPDKSAAIVVYCANGPCRNSGIAAHRLGELGYTNVRDYHEGKQDWIEAGLPVEAGKGAQAHAYRPSLPMPPFGPSGGQGRPTMPSADFSNAITGLAARSVRDTGHAGDLPR